jgi:hypothetical protein
MDNNLLDKKYEPFQCLSIEISKKLKWFKLLLFNIWLVKNNRGKFIRQF